MQYLAQNEAPFDLVVASGVLYHMREPFTVLQLLVLQLLAGRTNRTYIWTHYNDEQIIQRDPDLRRKFKERASLVRCAVVLAEAIYL